MAEFYRDVFAWNAGARTLASLSGDGSFSFTVKAVGAVVGFSNYDTTTDYYEITHAFQINTNQYRIIESGVTKTTYTTAIADAVFKLIRTDGVVTYYVDDVLVYTSITPSRGVIFGDCSLYAYDDRIYNATITNFYPDGKNSSDLLFIGPLTVAGVEGNPNFGWIKIGPLNISAEVALDFITCEAEIGPLWAFSVEGDPSWGQAELGPITAFGIDILELPEYNAGNITVGPVDCFGYEGVLDSCYGAVEIGPLWARGAEGDPSWGQAELGPLFILSRSNPTNYIRAEWPKITIVLQQAPEIFTAHEATYGTLVSTIHIAGYEFPLVFAEHSASWGLLALATHTATWESTTSSTEYAYTTHTATWESTTSSTEYAYTTHTATWESTTSSTEYAYTTHTAIWESVDNIYTAHTVTYKSIITAFAVHETRWCSVTTESGIFTIHTARYRSVSLEPQIIYANAYIEPDIQLTTCRITADEDSPYYQCEVELLLGTDYSRFMRDQAFTLHILDMDYSFIVEGKSLRRSIDEAGNYSEIASITGLSPLCLKASPRAVTITKTWTDSLYASEIVEELIGSVTWNLVDWVIPAYRLAADNNDPLSVAQQVVTAVGGLIESQPDGSIIVRHRWPTSINNLNDVTPDKYLYEDSIYAASESPAQDVLMNKIRITDSDVGYQDRLEYVANKLENGEDDPWNGMLYAFPSPWRGTDKLSFATTRQSKISLGAITEGVRIIAGVQDVDEFPAEVVTFQEGKSSVAYPIMTLTSFDWLDEDLGGVTVTPYSTTIEATSGGAYDGYSLAKLEYTSRYLRIPVHCETSTDVIEAQFLLLEASDGD